MNNKDLNKGYNWTVIPKKYKNKNPHLKHVDSFIIDISDDDPVKKFKEWRADYWTNENDIENK